ncbi:MAG: hypothetical protein M1837_001039 [Sclerophora amabilis]|nr:MAG: hypothetical protein M1837_001039 [Sclerophora amabilis]
MPQGPPTLPVIGNEHQIPRSGAHFVFTEWSKKYGGIFSLKRGPGTTLVITDRRLIRTLLDKKSTVYSHRPNSYVSHDLITRGDHLLVMHYGNAWRTIRKLVHQHFMEPVCDREHVTIQDAEALQLLKDFMTAPEQHMLHPKRFSNSIINSIVFVIRTQDTQTPYMKRLYRLMDKWSEVMEIGSTPPVDNWPWLKVIPQRLFDNWIKRARTVGTLMESLYTDALNRVYERREKGVQIKSFMDFVLDQQDKNSLTQNQLCFLGGVLMEGGSDTSSSIMLAIIQAMIKYPEVQKKAQAEIDAVIGQGRSPTWSDFASLPYINMIIKEGHRWRPVTPLGFPHALGEDDWIDDMFLSKGLTVILNVWGMHMDENTWEKPQHFIPERYANHPKLAPEYAASSDWASRDHYGYGAGRRICPGIHLAERNLFIGVAKLLWAFNFEEKPGTVNDSDPETGYSVGFLHGARDYGCNINVRSEKTRETILREFDEAEKAVFSRFDV